jgi:hypothetical protein
MLVVSFILTKEWLSASIAHEGHLYDIYTFFITLLFFFIKCNDKKKHYFIFFIFFYFFNFNNTVNRDIYVLFASRGVVDSSSSFSSQNSLLSIFGGLTETESLSAVGSAVVASATFVQYSEEE